MAEIEHEGVDTARLIRLTTHHAVVQLEVGAEGIDGHFAVGIMEFVVGS